MDEPLNSILPALMLLALALSFFYLSRVTSSSARSMRQKNGIPQGQVIYSDLDRPAQVLHSSSLALSGKPDYIVRDGEGRLIPVEIKSGRAKVPHRGHMLQLAAYCLLIEENYHMDVPYGIIVYSDKVQHKIEFDELLRSDLLRTLKEMKSALKSHSLQRGHSQRQKCRSCSFSQSCKSRLD
ncbi:MAG: CRISPR-associated protein Cas4 [Methanothrix sp.]|nr:CRISPR-associated protein Cas4 [Methanothrix sp.]